MMLAYQGDGDRSFFVTLMLVCNVFAEPAFSGSVCL